MAHAFKRCQHSRARNKEYLIVNIYILQPCSNFKSEKLRFLIFFSLLPPPKMQCQLNSEEKRLDFWVEKGDLLR